LYIAWFFKIDLLYNIDKSKAVDITKDIIYKNTKDKPLPMDIYKPAGITKGTKLPAIIFVHGEGTERIIGNAKEWSLYRSYGKFAASNNFIGVTFNRSRMNLNFKNAPKYIKCLISYYGLHDISTRIKAFNKEYEDYYPENYLPGDFADIPPLLIVKAEKDKVKGVNKSIDKLISIAKARNLKFEYIVHSTGKHAFDALNDNDETRVVIDKTLQFIKKNI
jgi:acetyl esterase/lipase